MSFEKFEYSREDIKIEVIQDTVGWYVIAYRPPFVASFYDALQDTKDLAFDEVCEVFGVDDSDFKKLS